MSGNLLRPIVCRLKQFTLLLWDLAALQEIDQVSDQMASLGDEEGASQDIWGSCSEDHRGSITIIDNVLTLGELAGGKSNLAGLTLAQKAS